MKYRSRKYIDMILKASSKWATLEPFSLKISVGDFGLVDPETGEFEYHGNIYEHKDVLAAIPELETDPAYKPLVSNNIDKFIITTESTKQADGDLGPSINAANLVDISLNLKFTFMNGKRGAFLVMYRPQSVDLPKNMVLGKLYKIPALKGMCLVTGALSCPAYALYLSEKNSESVSLALVSNVSGMTSTCGIQTGWKSEWSSGLYQEGYNLEGQLKYGPLFTIKQMRPKSTWTWRTGSEKQINGDDLWQDASAPWGLLDDEGKSEEVYDGVTFGL